MEWNRETYCVAKEKCKPSYHVVKVSLLIEQLLWGSNLNHFPLLDDGNAVCREDSRQPVCD